jgi:hypothetical protein
VITATDIAADALRHADRRLQRSGVRERVRLLRHSLDDPWPTTDFDLVVLSEVGYYLHADTLREVLDRELASRAEATVIAAHWRHPVADYPIRGDQAQEIIATTSGLRLMGGYRDRDVAIDVFTTGAPRPTCQCARDACSPASSRAGAGPPPAPLESGECGALGSSPAWHPQPSR